MILLHCFLCSNFLSRSKEMVMALRQAISGGQAIRKAKGMSKRRNEEERRRRRRRFSTIRTFAASSLILVSRASTLSRVIRCITSLLSSA